MHGGLNVFENWNLIEKYFRMSFISSFLAKNDLLHLFYWFGVAHFPLENLFICLLLFVI